MTFSSGVFRSHMIRRVTCDVCAFTGKTDIDLDAEINDAWWMCPTCRTVHTFDTESSDDEPGDDQLNASWN